MELNSFFFIFFKQYQCSTSFSASSTIKFRTFCRSSIYTCTGSFFRQCTSSQILFWKKIIFKNIISQTKWNKLLWFFHDDSIPVVWKKTNQSCSSQTAVPARQVARSDASIAFCARCCFDNRCDRRAQSTTNTHKQRSILYGAIFL